MQVYKIRIDGKLTKKNLTPVRRGDGATWTHPRRAQALVDQYNEQNPPLPGMEPSAQVVTYTLVEIQFT